MSSKGQVVPYVWGGMSPPWGTSLADNQFEETEAIYGAKPGTAFTRQDGNAYPKTGFDCSGIILRAAQACGIPYFFKNTTTAGKHLRTLADDEALEDGDLILIPGHIMVISDVEKNMLIDSCGYASGFGCVREIELNKVFRDIATYDELIMRSKTDAETEFLSIDSQTTKTFNWIKLLKMRSVF